MIDSITEEELKLSRIIKQYQDYLDELDGIGKANPVGEMGGKKVKKVESNDTSTAANLFKNTIQNKI